MYLMASPSSSKPRNYNFKVFCSFHGPDVRKNFLSHLREQFNRNGITMFDDEKIKRGGDLSPSLKEAIKESRISIVILSQRYASSSWCLDELVEILKCREAMKQIVMTVFYRVEPSDVRRQTGDFGIAFDETCAIKTDKEEFEWRTALTDVSNIAGEDSKKWDNDANMIKKIARDVSAQLNATPSKDFDGKVGLEAHLREMESLLDLDNVGVKIVGISGPPGIGKTTIARALRSLLSDRFQFTCFMDLGGSDPSGLHDDGMQLRLQQQLLSELLNQDGTRICHLEVLPQWLCDLRVLIILDDVNDVRQLKVLAKKTTWFGPGSRIIVTTEDKGILQQHGINNTYHVGFPSPEAALEIFCKYAFERSSPPHGFKGLAARITHLCGNLPLGLCVMGSSLFGKKQDEWECVIQRLETNPRQEIVDVLRVLRVSYERLPESEQTLFLHIALFFNNINGDLMKTMFADSDVDVNYGLKILENRSLISTYGNQITMHRLLKQVGKIANQEQESSKRQILVNADEICNVLEDATGTSAVSAISFDISNINEVSINKKAFKRMHNLRFLRIHKSIDDGNYRMHVPEEMEFPRRLRLLDWKEYPSKCLPPTFHPEYLVGLYMRESQLEKLWEGIQPLKNLKYMDLTGSKNLKEVPDLSNATNLEVLKLSYCESLKEVPDLSNATNLKRLGLRYCKNLKELPDLSNATNLEDLKLSYCESLKEVPDLSNATNLKRLVLRYCKNLKELPDLSNATNLKQLGLRYCKNLKELPDLSNATNLEELYLNSCESLVEIPSSFSHLHKLERLEMDDCINLQVIPAHMNLASLETVYMYGCTRLRNIPLLSTNITFLDLRCSDIERIPDCIKALHQLETLDLSHCRRLTSLPELPGSLNDLRANYCESLKTVFCPLSTPRAVFNFTNCFKLGQQARRGIIRRSFRHRRTILPGKEVPEEFDNRARGSSLTIVLDGNRSYTGVVVCVVISPNQPIPRVAYSNISWGGNIDLNLGYPVGENISVSGVFRTEHLYIYHRCFRESYRPEVNREIMFEFSSESRYLKMIECGAKFLTKEESIEWSNEYGSDQASEDDIEVEQTDCWSWLFLCFGLSDLFRGRRR